MTPRTTLVRHYDTHRLVPSRHSVAGDSVLVRIADDDNHLRALVAEQSLGVIYPSVRHDGGTCIACFRPALVMNVRRDATFRFTWRAGESDPVVSRAVSS